MVVMVGPMPVSAWQRSCPPEVMEGVVHNEIPAKLFKWCADSKDGGFSIAIFISARVD